MNDYYFCEYYLGGPIVITLPHMLGTAPEYRTVNGLKPDPEKHLIFADIEPVRIHKFIVVIMFN